MDEKLEKHEIEFRLATNQGALMAFMATSQSLAFELMLERYGVKMAFLFLKDCGFDVDKITNFIKNL